MTRSGPCRHCGVTCSPMWRKGPAEKAVLCNACGTRYRHRGNLNNYLPKLSKPNLDHYLNKLPSLTLKLWGKPLTNLVVSYHQGDGLLKFVIPTRKRSRRVCRSRVFCKERFQKQLFDEWVRQGKPINESSQHLLLSDNANNFIPTNEIGVGAILLKLDATSI